MRTLYSQRSDGKVQEWTIEVNGSKYRVHSGIVNGKIVTSKWTQCYGKNIGRSNETTPEEQAQLEAKAKWDKQINEGYSEDQSDLGAKHFEPMLAKNYNDYRKRIEYPVFSDRKYDGIRCVSQKKGLFSRNGKPFVSVPHIYNSLKPVFDQFPSLKLDGELYIHSITQNFNKICSLVKKTKPSEQDIQDAQVIEYHIYDCSLDNSDSFEKRNEFLKFIIKNIPHVSLVEHTLVNSQEELDREYYKYLDEGYEGQIIRIPNAPYENKRSRFLLKRKEWITDEFEIISVHEGSGNRSGTAGYAWVKKGKIKSKSNFKGSYEFVEEVYKRRYELIGKQATVKYFGVTEDNSLRFPYIIAIRDYE